MTKVSRNGFVDKNGKQVVLKDPTKADKVEGATAGNLASLDEEGNIQDSGKKPADFALADHQHDSIKTGSSFSSGAVVGTGITLDDNPVINLGLVKRTLGNTNSERANITLDNINNLNRALKNPSSKPENDDTKLITSKAVYDALAGKAGIYNGTLRIDSTGDNSYPIPEDGTIQTALNSFVESAEKDKMYNVLVQFATQNSSNHYYPAIVYWEISIQDDTVVHIYVGDYHFMATKPEGGTAWEQEEFDRYKISTFLETF